MKKMLRYPSLQGVLIGGGAAALAAVLTAAGALDWIELRTWDWRTRALSAPGAGTAQVTTIMIDQNSLDEAESLFGISWIWPREVYTYILDFCHRAGAKAVIFDMIYTDHSRAGVSDDAQFGEAIARGAPFAVALPMGERLGATTVWEEGAAYPLPPADRIAGMTPELLARITLPRATFPVPDVAGTATVLGNVISAPDADAVFRRMPPLRVFDNRLVPALGLSGWLAAHPGTPLRMEPRTWVVGNRRIPLDRHGNAILRYRGASQTHSAFSAAAILQSELRIREGEAPTVDPQRLKDTYVLLGVTAPGLMDLKPTPLGRTYPGMEVHATFLDNLIAGDFIRETPYTGAFAAMLLLGIAAGITVRCCRRVLLTTLAFPFFAIVPIAAGFATWPWSLWFPVAAPLTAALLAMVTAVIVNYAIEGRQKRFIKGAFKQYLSPVVIEKLMENPDQLTLGGEEKTLSIFFSDVQGFSSISEKLSPSELTRLLNEYLTAMTDIIHQTGGTIDKYEGDAIIAFWNAPLEQADHAVRAVQAALRCQAKLAQMRADLKTRYHSEIFVRIGINTGLVVVGNMGSNQRFDYTFLGDAGNLAARLEGINKQFNTFLLISGNTHAAIHGAFPAREISRVRVVGKTEPITIYEPLPAETADARHKTLAIFESALQAYYRGDFAAAQREFETLTGDDPVATVYARRCATLAANPPPDWDGIWNLTEK